MIDEREARNLRRFPRLVQDGWLEPDSSDPEPEVTADTLPPDPPTPPPEQGGTIAELRTAIADMDREQAVAALEAEREGRNRSTATDLLEAHIRRLDREAEDA